MGAKDSIDAFPGEVASDYFSLSIVHNQASG
jgi:hypothetical protein